MLKQCTRANIVTKASKNLAPALDAGFVRTVIMAIRVETVKDLQLPANLWDEDGGRV